MNVVTRRLRYPLRGPSALRGSSPMFSLMEKAWKYQREAGDRK